MLFWGNVNKRPPAVAAAADLPHLLGPADDVLLQEPALRATALGAAEQAIALVRVHRRPLFAACTSDQRTRFLGFAPPPAAARTQPNRLAAAQLPTKQSNQ